MTVGMALVMSQVARWLAPGLIVRPDDWLTGAPLEAGGVFIVRQDLIVIGVTVIATAVLAATSRWTHLGRRMRACADDRDAARAIGIDVAGTATVAFALGAAIAGLAGVGDRGRSPVLRPARVRSLRSPPSWRFPWVESGDYGRGAAAAVGVGLAEAVLARYLGAELRNIIILVVFVLLLVSAGVMSESHSEGRMLRPRRRATAEVPGG